MLTELDRGAATGQGRKIQPEPQSSDDRLRREGLLRTVNDTNVESNVQRIVARQRGRLVESRSWAAVTLVMFNIGGVFRHVRVCPRDSMDRSPCDVRFGIRDCGVTTALAFLFMSKPSDLFWMVPLMGAAQLAVFGGYAIYFPELFPTRLAEHGNVVLLQRGKICGSDGPISIAYLRNQYSSARGAVPLCRRGDVLVLPPRACGTALRAGDEGAAAAGIRLSGVRITRP